MANHRWDRRRLTPDLARQLRILPPWNNTVGACDTSELNTRLLFDLPRGVSRPETRVIAGDSNVAPKSAKAKHTHLGRSTVVGNSDEYSNVYPPGVHPKRHSLSTATAAVTHYNPSEKVDLICNSQTWSPHSTKSGTDEGPLVFDEETEFVNTLTIPLPPYSLKRPLKSTLASGKLRSPHYSDFQSLSNHPRNCAPLPSDALIRSDHVPHSTTLHPLCHPCNPITRLASTNGPGVMRSILGGDVAYSLLRDAGMF